MIPMRSVPAKSKDIPQNELYEDELINELLATQGQPAEVVAFGITYTGKLTTVDIDHGYVIVDDGENSATLELERIETCQPLTTI